VCVLATEFLYKAKQAKDVAIDDLRDAISFPTRWRHTASPIWPPCTSGAGALHDGEPRRHHLLRPTPTTGSSCRRTAAARSRGSGVCRFWTTRPVFAQPDWSQQPGLSRPAGPAPNSANACAHRDNYFGEIEMAAADLLTATSHEDGPITRHVVERMAAHLGFDCCTRRTCRNAPAR
jgi:hypothetical protein